MTPVTFDGSDSTGILAFTASFTSPLRNGEVIALFRLDRTFRAARHCLAYSEEGSRGTEVSAEEEGWLTASQTYSTEWTSDRDLMNDRH